MVDSIQTPSLFAEREGSYNYFEQDRFSDSMITRRYPIDCLSGVIGLIIQAIPVGLIYSLSKNQTAPDLLIVLEKKCTKAYNEFESIIELSMLGFPKGTCTIHNYGLLNAQLSKGHLFYNAVCIPENLIYAKNNEEFLSVPNEDVITSVREEAAFLFRTCFQKAVSFYDGAQYYLQGGIHEMAMFMLHQSCELTYRCLLNVLRGKDLKCHSPSVLRKHVKRFAPEVIGVFSESEEEELYYLQQLENAYIQARYALNYQVDLDELSFLNKKVGLLQELAKLIASRL